VRRQAKADKQANRIISAKARYQVVSKETSVPWFAIGALHMRESSGDFTTWLHNGDRMKVNGVPARTKHVPAGRPPNPNCSWEDGAIDALRYEQLDGITDWCVERLAYAAEKFNGFGYRNPNKNIPSPYLWGGTSVQITGKFTSDGKYDPYELDPQIGVMAILKRLSVLDPTTTFPGEPQALPIEQVADVATAPDAPDQNDQQDQGKAVDDESQVKSLGKSKTIWGGALGLLSTTGASASGIFSHLDNPYTLAAFMTIAAGGTVAAYLVFKGRIDINKIVEHLSQDDTPGEKPE
jgi:Uncharacterized conserved protein